MKDKPECLDEKISIFEIISPTKITLTIKHNLISYFLAPALAIGIISCSNQPSDYCCSTIQCERQEQVCAGKDENCYCLEKTCCEKTNCSNDEYCYTSVFGGECGCSKQVNSNYEH